MSQFSDYANVFLFDLAMKLFEKISINKYVIKQIESK